MILRRIAAVALDQVVIGVYIAAISLVFAMLPPDVVGKFFATPFRGQLTVLVILTMPVWAYGSLLEASK